MKLRHALPLASLLITACVSGPGRAPQPADASEAAADPAPRMAVADASTPSLDPAAPAQGAAQPAQGAAAQDAAQLEQDAERYSLAEQRKQFLMDEHFDHAQDFIERLRLQDARNELEAALELDPDSLRAKEMLAQVRALQGEPAGEIHTVTEELKVRQELRVQQMRADTEAALREAKLAIARSDYDRAIAELTIAQNYIRFAPYSIDWRGVDKEVADLLEGAKKDRVAAQQAAREAAQRKAFEELKAREQAQVDRQHALVTNIIDRAITAFDLADYDEAMDLADQALHEDPRNEMAKEIRQSAFRAGREKVRNDYVVDKREQFRRWQENLKEIQIPWTDVVTLPDADRWAEITKKRSRRRGIDLTQNIDPSTLRLQEQLRATTLQLPNVSDEESLSAVIDLVRTITGLPLVVDPAAENAAIDAGVVFNFSFENKLNAEQVLNLITDLAGEDVTWTVRHDAVLVTTKEKARGKPVIVNHDVQDLIFGLTDFLGPRIDRIRLLDDLEDEDGGGPFGGIGERPKMIEPDRIATLIQENVAVGTWEDEGISIESGEGYIIVVHTPEVQMQVRDFLEDLRRFTSSLVTIESKFLTVGSNWLQEIGVDFRGLDGVQITDVTNGLEDMASRGLDNGGTGTQGQNAAGSPSAGAFYVDGSNDYRGRTENFFTNALGSALSTIGGMTFQLHYFKDTDLSAILRAVEKSSDFKLINDQVLSVHNTQRAYVAVVNQRAYIQDFDVEVAQFQAVADPQINVLEEGVVLDVRPTIHHNRRYLTLEIQPTVARVVALRSFSTALGGNTSPVEFQLPEVEVASVYTTAVIPDGGSLMLGGLSRIRNIERRAEVPWLGRIPIVGFLFKQEGYDDENQSLIILIRARITDVREELKKIEVH
jgi:tetratricopeptide (TPR) repeat protein